jgi:hypothetical protein
VAVLGADIADKGRVASRHTQREIEREERERDRESKQTSFDGEHEALVGSFHKVAMLGADVADKEGLVDVGMHTVLEA